MRKCRNKKNFWLDDDDNKLLKNLSELSGRTQTEVIKKLINGATIKEKPPEDFYKKLNGLIELRKELKKIRDVSKFTKELDTKKVENTLRKIDDLRMLIEETYLK